VGDRLTETPHGRKARLSIVHEAIGQIDPQVDAEVSTHDDAQERWPGDSRARLARTWHHVARQEHRTQGAVR
jgi:hypothetical protein